MIITPKQPRDGRTISRIRKLVPYMLRGKGEERCTWYMAGNLEGLDRQEDAGLAVEVMEVLQDGNVRAKGNKTYHLVISFHPEDRRLAPAELEDVVRRAVTAAGLGEHQYIAVRHSEQEHEHLHVAVNKIHPETLKIHHPYKAIPAFQALASILEKELGLHRVDRSRGRPESHRARDFEAHRCIESFSGWARRTIGDATGNDRIGSWPALHDELARFGVRLVRRGNGLAIVDATRPNLACKASALGRGWSKQRLSERYGEFVPGPEAAEVAREQVQPYEERPLGRALEDGLWREYREALDAARRHRRELREAMASRIQAARSMNRPGFAGGSGNAAAVDPLLSVMDVVGWLLAAGVGLAALAGVRWRWPRIPGAILIAVVSTSLLDMLPGSMARAITSDIASTPCEACRIEILYPMVTGCASPPGRSCCQ